MRYFFYEYIKNLDNPTGARGEKYKCSTFMHDNLYNTCPKNGTPLMYSRSPEEGYTSLEDCQSRIWQVLQFNPVVVDGMDWLMNSDALLDPVDACLTYLKTANGQYEEYNYNQAYVLPTVGGTAMGYNSLEPTQAGTRKRAANSFWGSTTIGTGNNVACNAIESITVPNHSFHINHWFLAFPEKLVEPSGDGKTGTLDFTTLVNDHDDNYWLCMVVMTIFKDATTGRWHYTIELDGLSYNMSNALNRMQGKDVEYYDPENPYRQPDQDPGGHNEDPDDDPIDFPPLPDIDISDTGAVNIYRMTKASLQNLFGSIRSIDPGTAVLNWWKNPIEGILGIFAVGYPINMGAGEQCKMLGWNLQDVVGSRCPHFQYLTVGSKYVNRKQHNDSFLSYDPYCKVSIHLPFIGIRALDADEVMNHTITVKYMCDNTCGNVTAFIKIGNSVKYEFSGNAASQVPLCQENWGQTFIAGITAAAGAGMGAAGAVGSLASHTGGALTAGAGIGLGALQGAGGVGNVMSLTKTRVERSGSLSGSAGLMGVKDCYLIFEDVVPLDPDFYTEVAGKPCGQGVNMGALSGYNIIETTHLHGIPATASELDEIETLLHEGVIF